MRGDRIQRWGYTRNAPGRVSRLLLVLALALASGRARAAETDLLDDPQNQLVAIIRVADVTRLNQEIDALLAQLNPRAEAKGRVQAVVGDLIRNASLARLAENPFLEVLVFDPTTVSGNPCVAAFPVTEALDYRKALTGQQGIREEGTVDDITMFTETGRDAIRTLHLSVTANLIAIFGLDSEAVRRARDLYERAGERGFLRERSEALVARIHLRRLMERYDKEIQTELARFREDILQDVVGENCRPDHPLGRSLGQGFSALRNLLRQMAKVELTATLSADHLQFACTCSPASNSPLRETVAHAVQQPPSIAACFPPATVSFQESTLWPELWLPLLDEIGGVLAAGMKSVIGQEVRRDLATLRDLASAADPQAAATALLAPPAEAPGLGPAQVLAVRWKQPDAVEALVAHALHILREDSPIQELLVQNQFEFKAERLAERLDVAGAAVDQLRLRLTLTGEPAPDQPVSFYGAPREYLLARSGSTSVVVTSATPSAAELVAAARSFRERTLASVLDGLAGRAEGLGAAPPYRQTLALTGGRPAVFLAGISPLAYLQLALDAAADWRPAELGNRGNRIPRALAEEFRAYPTAGDPIGIAIRSDPDHVRLALRVPRVCLQELARACLGISTAGAPQE